MLSYYLFSAVLSFFWETYDSTDLELLRLRVNSYVHFLLFKCLVWEVTDINYTQTISIRCGLAIYQITDVLLYHIINPINKTSNLTE